jgi:hypothetical protein
VKAGVAIWPSSWWQSRRSHANRFDAQSTSPTAFQPDPSASLHGNPAHIDCRIGGNTICWPRSSSRQYYRGWSGHWDKPV